MNIIYASDNHFAPILAVSLMSLYQFNRNVNVMIIEHEISEENKKILNGITEKYAEPSIIYQKISLAEMEWDIKLVQDRGSAAQFSRLFFSGLIPEAWKRVIYLDCDTLILKSLQELWTQDIEGYIVGGILDAFSIQNYKLLGIDEKDNLINSGVMLIDVEKWKKQKTEQKIIRYIIQRKGKIPQGDQGILNNVLQGKIKILPLIFNEVAYLFDFSYVEIMQYRNPAKYYSLQQVKEAKKNPVIIHFTTSFASMRPWQEGCSHMYAKYWKEYYLSLFTDFKTENKKIPVLKSVMMKMMKGRARHLLLKVVGILHSYVKPMLYKMKRG